MNNYFDFVLCKHENGGKTFLFHAPAFSKLKKGDLVKVETVHGETMATVVSCITLAENDDAKIDFIMNATGAKPDVKKVLSKVEYIQSDFDYGDEVESDDKTGNAVTS